MHLQQQQTEMSVTNVSQCCCRMAGKASASSYYCHGYGLNSRNINRLKRQLPDIKIISKASFVSWIHQWKDRLLLHLKITRELQSGNRDVFMWYPPVNMQHKHMLFVSECYLSMNASSIASCPITFEIVQMLYYAFNSNKHTSKRTIKH